MNLREIKTDEQYLVRTTDGQIVIDLGPGIDGSVDTLGETVIAVVEGEQYELNLDKSPERVFMKNGVLTIERGEQA